MENEFGVKEGEEFPYQVGDEFTGAPSQISRFMKMVFTNGGQVEVLGDTVRITGLPEPAKKEKPKVEPKAAAKIESKPERKPEAKKVEAPARSRPIRVTPVSEPSAPIKE